MASWTDIANNLVAVGAKPFATTMQALRDNVIAALGGAPGAPRLHGDAVGTLANEGLPVLAVAAGNTYRASEASFITTDGSLVTNSTSDVVAKSFENKLYTGSMRFFATHRSSTTSSVETSVLSIYKNSVLQATWSEPSNVPQGRSIDLAVEPDDVIEWRHRITNSSGDSVVSDIFVEASDAYQEVIPLGRASQLVP